MEPETNAKSTQALASFGENCFMNVSKYQILVTHLSQDVLGGMRTGSFFIQLSGSVISPFHLTSNIQRRSAISHGIHIYQSLLCHHMPPAVAEPAAAKKTGKNKSKTRSILYK
jgi:hypothetical protein